MSEFNFECNKCKAIILPDEVCPHGNCQECQEVCCKNAEHCADPNCTCQMSFKNFRPTLTQSQKETYEFT